MFGWFTPKCPLDTQEKVWVERRMLWLANRFGIERMRAAPVVLPTDEFFPDPYPEDESGAHKGLDRLCGHMGIDPVSVSLQVLDDEQMPGAAGLYEIGERSVIFVARSQLAAPLKLLKVLAHELAHELLLKGGHLTTEVDDHELVTDLLPVFLGLGVFAANETVDSQEVSQGNASYFTISKLGYLSSITLGYALALFAFGRGEDSPPWAAHLRHDARETLRVGLRYLHKTQDTLFHPDTLRVWPAVPTPDTVAEWLTDPSASLRFAALQDIVEHSLTSPDLLPAVERSLRDRDPDVQCAAVGALGRFGAAAAHAVPRLFETAWHGTSAARAAACGALGEIGANPGEVVPVLGMLLDDDVSEVACAAAVALPRFETNARPAEPGLLAALERAAAVTDYTRLEYLIDALRAINPDAKRKLRAYLGGRDPQVRNLALGVFEDRSSSE